MTDRNHLNQNQQVKPWRYKMYRNAIPTQKKSRTWQTNNKQTSTKSLDKITKLNCVAYTVNLVG